MELGQEALSLGIEGVGLGRPLCQLGLGRGAVGGQGLAGLPLAVQLGHPEGDFQPPQRFPQVQVLPGLLGLGFQGAPLEVQFLQLIPDAHQVFLGALQLALGLLLLVAAVGDPRRLLKDLPPLGALGGEDLVDAALADEGVPLLAQAGVHEEFIHIPQADGLAVEEVFTLPGAVVPPGDRHLLPPVGEEIPALFQGEGDLGKALAAAGLGPAEDHILHLAPPEGFGGLLPQNPADGVGKVGLSAAVGPHDGGDGMLEGEDRPVRKGLEPLQFQRFQPQGVFLLWVCRDGFGPRPGSWRLVVVQDRDTLEALSHCRQGSAQMLAGAGAAILVFARPAESDVWTEDCAILMSNLHLAAHSQGLGSCWIQGRLRQAEDGRTTEAFCRERLALPEDWALEAILSLGIPAESPPPHTLEEADWGKVTFL